MWCDGPKYVNINVVHESFPPTHPHANSAIALLGPVLPHYRGSTITHNDTPHSVDFLWTSYQPDAETST